MPATTTGDTTTFPFRPGVYTALLTTMDKDLTGDLSGKTLRDTIAVSGDADTFMTQYNGGNCVSNIPAAVRFYFRSPAASGPSTGSPPAGFYTQYWWSDAMHVDLTSGNLTQTITESMTPTDWSDWNGQPAAEFPLTFAKATQNVKEIGLSFGGDFFFETGVIPVPTNTNNEQFSSTFTES